MWRDGVMSRHLMWCDFLCGVMRCHVTCSHVIRFHLLWSDATQEDGMLWACDAMWLVVRSYCIILCDSKRLCAVVDGSWYAVNYGERFSQYYDPVLQSTIPYYKVLQTTTTLYSAPRSQCWSVLQSTTLYQFVWWSQHMKRPVHCAEQPIGCKRQWNYDIHGR